MFLSFLSCSLFSYAANPRAVIVKCDGCAYDVDVDVDVDSDEMGPNGALLYLPGLSDKIPHRQEQTGCAVTGRNYMEQ